MPLSPALTHLLAVALSNRTNDADHLAREADISGQAAREGLESLRRLGYLEVDDGVITYRRPEIPTAEVARERLDAAAADLSRATAEVQQTLRALPPLLQAWDTGMTDERTIPVDSDHGADAAAHAWMLHFARDTPKHCSISIPTLAPVVTVAHTHDLAEPGARAMAGLQVRLLVSVSDASDPDLAPVLQRARDRGTQVRSHPDPPSFFWVSDDVVTGLPYRWGDSWPTSVLTARSPAIAAVSTAIFEEAWRLATPLAEHRPGWEPMLRLMNEGLTMEAAASRLGMAQRTGRRRVAEAMSHFGASSHFTLGVAWERARTR